MTRFDAATARERRSLVADAVAAHRRRASEAAVFEADPEGDEAPPQVRFADRLLRLRVVGDERERLETLLGEFPVFKVKQPETRKADDGVVYVSALADPKHAADFVDRLFLDVYECDEEYRLWAVQV